VNPAPHNLPANDLEPIPSNIDAEQAIIGCALYENSVVKDLDALTPAHFFEPLHASAWSLILARSQRGEPFDPIWLSDQLGSEQAFHDLGGIGYFADLVANAPNPASARAWAEAVIGTAQRRDILALSAKLANGALTADVAPFDLICTAERELGQMVQDAAPASVNMIDARSSAMITLDEIEREAEAGRSKGYMTGLRCFDRRLRGLRPGWLVVVAGRPSMGKTSLGRAAAMGCARKTSANVLFFALEMARRELDERTLSQLSHLDGDGIAYKEMSGDRLSPSERLRLRGLAHKVPTNFIIDDSPVLSVSYVRRRVLALKRRGPLAAVFIDYLQIMDRPDAKGRNEASVIGEMTKALKQLAREAETCVVLLSQINRGVESRDDKRPQLSDLRESGAIEQDANAVLFPYREAYYLERAEPKDVRKQDDWRMACAEVHRRMDVIAAKVRQGAVGTDQQVYFAEFDHVEDAAEDRR
jgi:replicative DNA helicase